MTNPSSLNRPMQTQQTEAMPPEQIAPAIGEQVQLHIGDHSYFSSMVGQIKGQAFIVTIPDEGNNPLQLDAGMPLSVRFSADKRSYAFDTEICGVSEEPFSCLYLAYPQQIRALKERQYDRFSVNIAGTADASDGNSFSCMVRDISIGGALIALQGQTGGINDPLWLTLRVEINGVEYELSLNSEIRSIRVKNEGDHESPLVLQGLAFNDLSEQDVLALAAFGLLPNLNAA